MYVFSSLHVQRYLPRQQVLHTVFLLTVFYSSLKTVSKDVSDANGLLLVPRTVSKATGVTNGLLLVPRTVSKAIGVANSSVTRLQDGIEMIRRLYCAAFSVSFGVLPRAHPNLLL